MAPRKLSDSDKQDITRLYCQPGETTSTLAKKFGVSSSTVSRVLKQLLSDDDYAALMQWKRGGERGNLNLPQFQLPTAQVDAAEKSRQNTTPQPKLKKAPKEDVQETSEQDLESTSKKSASKNVLKRRSRRRSTATSETVLEDTDSADSSISEEMEGSASDAQKAPSSKLPTPSKRVVLASKKARSDDLDEDDKSSDVAAWVSEGLASKNEYDADDDWDDEDWDDEADDDDELIPQPPREEVLAILSFENFVVKKPCYLVVDRSAELITCALKDFAELGLIPQEEEQARTLPVFDNHRVARRFARRNQRIIKVPNGLMLNKTQEYLQAKGITRLLFDGQVYALS